MNTPDPTDMNSTPDPADALKTTAILSVRFARPGARRKPKPGSVIVRGVDGDDPDADSASVSVDLLRAAEFSDIGAHDTATRAGLKAEALPAGKRIANGSYLLPIAAVERVYGFLARRKAERAELVDAFCRVYPSIVADAATRLQAAFEPRMFSGARVDEATGAVTVDPSGAEAVRELFALDYDLEVSDREAGVRAASRSLSAEFVERELARARASGEAMLADIRDAMRLAFAGLIDKARESLRPATEGEGRKVFRVEHVERISAFLAAFADRNVAGDGELAGIIAQARAVIAGVDPGALADSRQRDPRVRLAAALDEVAATLAPILVPKRRITLEPAEVGAL